MVLLTITCMTTIDLRVHWSLFLRRSGLLLGLVAVAATAPRVAAKGTFTLTGRMHTVRGTGHTATLLADGRVLVAGGFDAGAMQTAEIYDPATGSWNNTGDLVQSRGGQKANLLPNGKVLISGGDGGGSLPTPLSSAELFDPATGTWSSTGAMHQKREDHTATSLPDGRVLVAGAPSISTAV